MTSATRIRRSVSAKLSGLEIPEAFACATVSAACRDLERQADSKNRRDSTRDARRNADKVRALLAGGAL